MTLYVDDVRHPFGRMIMCHAWADSREELFQAMREIGVDTRWFQPPPKASWEHFDISLAKKDLLLMPDAQGRARAVLTDKYGPVLHTARLRGDQRMIGRVMALRARAGRDAETGMAPIGKPPRPVQFGLAGL